MTDPLMTDQAVEVPSRPRPFVAYATSNRPPPLVTAPAGRDWFADTGDRFANRCLPMLIANQGGWLILNNFSFTATWSGGDGIDAVRIDYGRGGSPPLAGSHFGYGIVSWRIPYLFRTPPGFDLLVRGPANAPKDGVSALEGVVETDWASSPFTMNWKITRPDTPVHFARDEPICMLSPQPRGLLESFEPRIVPITDEPATARRHTVWCTSRREFIVDGRAGRPTVGGSWQRHYFQGRHADGEPAEQSHRTRLRLAEFLREDP
jgi:hypothetical protein